MKIIPLSMKCIAGGTQPEVSTTRENTTESMLGWETQKKRCTAGKIRMGERAAGKIRLKPLPNGKCRMARGMETHGPRPARSHTKKRPPASARGWGP